ncbi:MAG: zeta toxin family protein [Deltaproteobacteria bacterium]|nr:zeta toxin family protein [Deltaproteobacteria bacterium]
MIKIEKPKLIIVAGPNGSGKTTVTEKLLRHKWMKGCVYINPDIIAEEQFGGWNSKESIIKAAEQAKKIREDCLNRKTDIAFETVFSTHEKLEFIKRAKTAGFFLRMFFVCTDDPAINAARVAIRVMEGGHEVPIIKIIKRYYKSIANCIEAVEITDRIYFYDNSINNKDPLLIFRICDGKIAKIYNPLLYWTKNIADSASLPYNKKKEK